MHRRAVVAGQFYPSQEKDLSAMLRSFKLPAPGKQMRAIGCVLPHAGYLYSGKVAAATLAQINIPQTCVILGPNHTGFGPAASIMTEGTWETPLGDLTIDEGLAQDLLNNSSYLEEDATAHAYEHSIEVELPLLRSLKNKPFEFVPIILAPADTLMYNDIARTISACVKKSAKDVLLVASSDMTHYETQKQVNAKDQEAIEAILNLDENELFDRVQKKGISMCGLLPVYVLIKAAKSLGAQHAQLASYQTSGDSTGDYSSVVGYAGITIS